MRIVTVTTEFDQVEDRLRLVASDKDSHVRILWLTRRLALRLIPALVQGLQIQGAEAVPPAAVQAAQVYAQLQARLNRKPALPVSAGDDTWVGLVNEITVKTAANGTRILTLKCDGSDCAELLMNQTDLRLWLQLLQHLFLLANWHDAIWPEWMPAPASAKGR